MLTLLAPARDINVAKAAIQAGADAVYIGADAFGARQAAANSLKQIQELVSYARMYGVDVLVTLNTLLTEDERQQAVQLAWRLYEIGVDALIVQDMRLLQELLPPIRLHASTQCDNRTAEQVMRLQQAGFRRVVLARELSLNQIRDIHKTVSQTAQPIELEAFVHGALCVSYSGRCYMSEVMMNRSANRGCCAQMCRQRYDVLDKDGNEVIDDTGRPIHQRYVLSLQDMDRSQYLKEMVEAGVTTFKVEGRLKDAAYVTNVVAYYRQLLDQLFPNEVRSHHSYKYGFTPNPEKTFHRGATDYFLTSRTRQMADWNSPKSTGEYIGTVILTQPRYIEVRLREGITLHTGDGINYGDTGFAINKIEGNRLYPNIPRNCAFTMPALGTRLFRNQDNAFLSSLTAERRIPVTITMTETADGFCLSMCQDKKELARLDVTDDKQEAENKLRVLNQTKEQLAKLGDTPYIAKEVVVASLPYFFPVKRLNQWRRELVAAAIKKAAETRPTDDVRTVKSVLTNPQRPPKNLMTCQYCLLSEMGHCRKTNPMSAEPAYLRLQNGKMMRLLFHCSDCQMEIQEC
ncbi:MAG: U32 family peptidase [Paludibacteraceae bacterium]|nr:U32 family peptidase [Paludibacteraceae bacterium]